MKLGINTHFIMKFDFVEGLAFCQQLDLKAIELAATGPAAKKYCDVETLLRDNDARQTLAGYLRPTWSGNLFI